MRYPHYIPQHDDRPDIDRHGAASPDAEHEREPRGDHPHGRDSGPRGGHGFRHGGGHGFRHGSGHGFRHGGDDDPRHCCHHQQAQARGGHGCDQQRDAHHGHHGQQGHVHHGHAHHRQQRHDAEGHERHGGGRRRPTLERSIMKAARGIRRAGVSPEQLRDRISAAVSHDDYVTTMRTLRRIGKELRAQR